MFTPTPKEREQITIMQKKLDLTYDEAVELFLEDKEVDRMTKSEQWNSDLTPEQIKAQKQAKNVSKGATGKQSKPKERKIDEDKKLLIAEIAKFAETLGATATIENDQKIIRLVYNDRKFKLDLSATREKK